MAEASASRSFEISGSSVQHREAMTTWGMLALAVFIAVGMGEWSKRQAAGETVIEPAVMEQAVKMAAAAAAASEVNVKVNVNESGKRPSSAANPLRGSATEGFEIKTSAGAER